MPTDVVTVHTGKNSYLLVLAENPFFQLQNQFFVKMLRTGLKIWPAHQNRTHCLLVKKGCVCVCVNKVMYMCIQSVSTGYLWQHACTSHDYDVCKRVRECVMVTVCMKCA